MSELNYQGVVDELAAAQRVCLITHLRPDADAIGSITALCLSLRQLGKEVRAVVGQRREISANLLSIPGARNVALVDVLPANYDLYVTLDCGSLDRTGTVADGLRGVIEAGGTVVCIDHHDSNPGFGTVNLVDSAAESTTVVLTQLIDMLSVQVDRDIAHALYAGLVTDTGSFRWGRPQMHQLAARLMHYGLDTKQIAVDLLDTTRAKDLHMIGTVLSGLQVVKAGDKTLAVLTAGLENIAGHEDSAVEFLVEFVRALEGSDMGVVFKEQSPGVWATSLRSSTLDCSDIAMRLGGGGHIPAAGYTTAGTADEILAQLVAEVTG